MAASYFERGAGPKRGPAGVGGESDGLPGRLTGWRWPLSGAPQRIASNPSRQRTGLRAMYGPAGCRAVTTLG